MSRVGFEFGGSSMEFGGKLFFGQRPVLIQQLKAGPEAVHEFFALGG